MQHNVNTGTALTTEERAAAKLKAMADGLDPSGWTDADLVSRGYASQGEPQSSQGEPQSSQGEPQSSQGEPQSSQSSQGEPQIAQSGQEPPPADSPLEQQMQDIARKLDKWQNEHELQPVLGALHQRIEQAVADSAKIAAQTAAQSASQTAEPVVIKVHAQKGGVAKVLDNPHPATEVLLRAIRAGVNVMVRPDPAKRRCAIR
jgi:hypothetical protein